MTTEEQLRRWVEGDPVHLRDETGEQCAPDFSCCKPELLQPEDVRRAFAAADERERMRFLGTFLQAAFALAGAKVHVAGRGEPE